MTLHKGIDGKMYKLRLKIPYNFDPMLVDKIADIKNRHDDIEYFFFFPCWREDGYTSRQVNAGPLKWQDYENNVNYIKNHSFNFEILFQQPGQIIDSSILKKYLNLGARRFTMYEDRNAELLKRIDPSAFISASITKVLKPEQIQSQDLSMYDEICLFMWYNHNIDTIKTLPKNYNYSILANAICCTSTCSNHLIHWFYEKTNAEYLSECPYRSQLSNNITISRQDYYNYFSELVQVLKLTDRSMPSSVIENIVKYYSGEQDENLDFWRHGYFDHDFNFFNRKSRFPKSFSIKDFKKLFSSENNKIRDSSLKDFGGFNG